MYWCVTRRELRRVFWCNNAHSTAHYGVLITYGSSERFSAPTAPAVRAFKGVSGTFKQKKRDFPALGKRFRP